MRLSRMISSFLARVAPPPKPSATSASPSSCSAPVATTSAAVANPARRSTGRPSSVGERQGQPADEADRDARDRRRPGDAVNVERRTRLRLAHAQAGEEAQCAGDVADEAPG